MEPRDVFSPQTREWFRRAFAAPTPAQTLGWPAIASRAHTLIQAPTGSGKTLAAFLYGIDRLNSEPGAGLRLLYVSPLKALNYDIERNLRGPLAGLESRLRVGVRTGDTPQKERAAMLKDPPDILITTPESLYLLLTSRAREILRGVRTLILDEVHAVAGTKRGAHLALSVERLERHLDEPMQRIGLSATQRPLEEIGRFVSGARPIRLVDAGVAKELDLQVVVPLEDMRELPSTGALTHPAPADGQEMDIGTERNTQSIWPSIYPKFRADLLESAVVAERMRAGAIEETVIPRNPLDVLAQQIVAICAEDEISVDDLHELVCGAYPFADLSRTQLENVLDMLAGRYPSDEFAELRPRIVWDRTAGVIRGRQGARRLAVTNAGTIPDRGLFGVHLVDGGGLVDEHRLDERAAKNLLTFLNEQAAATGAVPSDRTVVLERFRDEIGDWRLCILTPFGARVHAPWALALG